MAAPESIRTLVQELRSRHPHAGELPLALEGCPIRFSANESSLLADVAEYMRPFRADRLEPAMELHAIESEPPELGVVFTPYPPGPGKTRIKDEFVDLSDGRILRKRLTNMHFLFGETDPLCIGPSRANCNQVVNFINNRFIQFHIDRGHLLCHAAGVARAGVGLAIAGLSGRGKSTLSLHLLGRGFDFVTNDRLLIRRMDRGIAALGVAKLPRVNPGTLLHNPALTHILPSGAREALRNVSPDTLWALEQKYDVDVERCFGEGCFRPRAALRAAIILTWTRDGGPFQARTANLVEREDLLAAIMKPLGVHYYARLAEPPDASPSAYLAALEGLDVFEFTGGVDFDAAAHACRELLGG